RTTLGARGFPTAAAILALLFGAATYNRNRHVAAEGAIAKRILDSLPIDQWRQGAWEIELAEADPPLTRFGIYSYQGLATIDVGAPDHPAECALQLATRNRAIQARVVSAAEIQQGCSRPSTCFLVHANGSVSEVAAKKLYRVGTFSRPIP